MIRRLSSLIAWGCTALMLLMPAYGVYLLVDIDAFAQFARSGLQLPIQWHTVEPWQLYCLWLLSGCTLLLAIAALFNLRKAFVNFSHGEMFTLENSRSFRLFSLFVLAQAVAIPIQHSASSVLLSLNHPASERVLSIALGSDTVKTLSLGIILWVVSEILVAGNQLEKENREFV